MKTLTREEFKTLTNCDELHLTQDNRCAIINGRAIDVSWYDVGKYAVKHAVKHAGVPGYAIVTVYDIESWHCYNLNDGYKYHDEDLIEAYLFECGENDQEEAEKLFMAKLQECMNRFKK